MSIDIRPEYRTGDSFDDESIPSVNMANGNAATVFTALGWTTEEQEHIASEGIDIAPLDLTSRLMLAGAFPEMVQERPASRVGNWIDGGADHAYIARKMEEIKNVAWWADQHGRRVSIY